MKAFLLISGEYEDKELHAVCTSMEMAETLMQNARANGKFGSTPELRALHEVWIEEWDMDELYGRCGTVHKV